MLNLKPSCLFNGLGVESEEHRDAEVGRCLWRSLVKLEQVAQGCVRLGFEYLQGWRLPWAASSDNLGQCLTALALLLSRLLV